MACPYFMPTRKLEEGLWLHPSRLPLGAGWQGYCTAPGHVEAQPSTDQLRQFCNLGYAAACSRLPQQRPFDAVRFSIAREQELRLQVCYVCESGHCPAGNGLTYDLVEARWIAQHADPRIQKMAECYLESYLLRRNTSASAASTSS